MTRSNPHPPRKKPGGWVNPKDLPKGPNGHALCRYCKTEVSPPRRTFCSGERAVFRRGRGRTISPGSGCVHEHCIRSNPGYARDCVFSRDLGVCALCGRDCKIDGEWQADHIIPVAEGGGSCGLEGFRTLCSPCHLQETAKLQKRLAASRRDSK